MLDNRHLAVITAVVVESTMVRVMVEQVLQVVRVQIIIGLNRLQGQDMAEEVTATINSHNTAAVPMDTEEEVMVCQETSPQRGAVLIHRPEATNTMEEVLTGDLHDK